MRKNEAMMKKPVKSTRASTSRIIDLDKTVNSIEELLSQKYGSDPFDSSIDYNKSDSDFKPWGSRENSGRTSPTEKLKTFSFQQVVNKKKEEENWKISYKQNYIVINLHQ